MQLDLKRKKYDKKLNQLVWISKASSAISVLTGASGIATSVMVAGLPVVAILAGVSTISASIRILCSSITKKYQKKLQRNYKIQDTLSQSMVLFEQSLSRCVEGDDRIVGELVKFDRKNSEELRSELEKNLHEEIRKLKAKYAYSGTEIGNKTKNIKHSNGGSV